MNTDFKPNSPTIVFAFSSLPMIAIGGPLLWVGANAALSTTDPMWARPTMYAGSGIFAVGYLLFVLTLLSAFATILIRSTTPSDHCPAN